ncbi:MAG: hypothetical protein AAGA26_00860 [Pseudomonadota bacterium]
MKLTALLEDFSIGKVAQPLDNTGREDSIEIGLAKIRGEARAEGFADGVASVEAEKDRENHELLASITEALADVDLVRKDIESQLADTIVTSTLALVHVITPHLIGQRLVAEINNTLRDAFNEFGSADVTIIVHPNRVGDVTLALGQEAISARIEGDLSLDPGSARLDWKSGYDQINVTKLIEQAVDLLEQHLSNAVKVNIDQRSERRAVHE